MRRDPVYVEVVLEPGFTFARERLARYMQEINLAHVLTLLREGHLSREDGQVLLRVIGPLMEAAAVPDRYNPAFEDLFFMIEDGVAQKVGADAVGSMHLGLSRNDLDTAMFRMAARDRLVELAENVNALRRAVLALADGELETVMPAYTHNQQAQPTTLGHYLAGVEAALGRDAARLNDAWSRTNLSTLGAAALAGTGFPVDRAAEGALLGFEGLVENTYDAVASADYLVELASCGAILATDLSRFLTDLLYWCTNEVAALRLAPQFIQVSSIMPQKRNPVALEHLRALVGKALGAAGSANLLLHNVPFGDVNDAGEQLQPILHGQCDTLAKALRLLTAVVATLRVDREVLERRVNEGFTTATELADTLVRVDGLKFRRAHEVVSTLVTELSAQGRSWRQLTLAELNGAMRAKAGRESRLSAGDLAAALDPREFVRRRRNLGGPARERLAPHLALRRGELGASEELWLGRRQLLAGYRRQLSEEWRAAVSS